MAHGPLLPSSKQAMASYPTQSGLDPDRPAEPETGGGVGSSVGNTKRDDVCKELSNRMGTHEFLVTMTIDDDDDDDTPHRKRKCFCLMSS